MVSRPSWHIGYQPAWGTLVQKEPHQIFVPTATYAAGKTPKSGDCDEQPLPPDQRCPKCKGKQSLHTEECNNIPDWFYHASKPCVASVLVNVGILENGWATSAILNVYHKSGGKLGQHYDSPHLFVRPIIGISLFGEKPLTFGVKGLGMRKQDFHYAVNMPRGAVTVMYGFAANKINHAVLPVPHKAATLLLRRMHPTLLGEKWCAKNTVTVNQKKICDDDTSEQPAKRLKASGDESTTAASTSSGCSPMSRSENDAPLDFGNGPVVADGVDHNRKLWGFHHSRRASSNGSAVDLDGDEL